MTTHTRRPHLRVACVTVLFLVAGFRGVSTGAVGDRPVFSGQATAVQADVLSLDRITVADTGYFKAPEFLGPAPCTEEGISISNVSVAAEILCEARRGQCDHSQA